MEKKSDYLLLVINPGSTSTKLGIYDGEEQVLGTTLRHDSEELHQFASTSDQVDYRQKFVFEFLEQNDLKPTDLDAVVGRGGLIKPLESGTYTINDKMIEDLKGPVAGRHASCLGGLIASRIGRQFGLPNFVVDPVVVDEMEPAAKLSGIPGIERRSVFHALNSKAAARRAAADLGTVYENGRFVVAHMGGGISVGAHRYGRVIDVNDGQMGEGPFSPERSGGVTLVSIIDMCFSGDYTKQEMYRMVMNSGGMLAYLGTNDLRKVETMIRDGDEFAALVLDSMAYQVAKEIGSMAAVLDGRVNAIILTGGLAYSNRFTGSIKQRVDLIAPVITYPGEFEMEALVDGALSVLRGKTQALEY